jgi:hypothetical protein
MLSAGEAGDHHHPPPDPDPHVLTRDQEISAMMAELPPEARFEAYTVFHGYFPGKGDIPVA